MRKGVVFPIVFAVFLGAFSASSGAKDYLYDQAHSSVSFTLRHLGIITVSGTFKDFSGAFSFDEQRISASRVTIDIRTGTVDSGNTSRDNHLRSKNFFWSDRYPAISFISHEVRNIQGRHFDVRGYLTIKGIRRPVVFATDLLENPLENGRLLFHAWTVIRRKDFQLGTNSWVNPIMMITNEELRIDLEIQGTPKT